MKTHGYYRFAAVTPQVKVADVPFNVKELVARAHEAAAEQADVALFPELCITGATCGDLFFQPQLIQAAAEGLQTFAEQTEELDCAFIVGLPLAVGEALYNVAAVVQHGEVHGFVPKSVLPNYRGHGERRWFQPADGTMHDMGGVPLGTDLIFADAEGGLSFGIEICEDLWSVTPPSNRLALLGARVIFNPAASIEQAGKAALRRRMVARQSEQCTAAYVMANAGVGESSQDAVYGGHALIADCGEVVAEGERFSRGGGIVYADIDVERIGVLRRAESSFNESAAALADHGCEVVDALEFSGACDLRHAHLPTHPFLPRQGEEAEYCEDVLNIQAAGLARRMEQIHAKALVLGVSGGLDSTLAMLVCVRACKRLGMPASSILALTMPGFGTTGRTYNNAVQLIKLAGAEFKEVDIKPACMQHFKDIGFDPAQRTNTYENVQARERTAILMNLANLRGGLLVGTGDLSELALGWCTYNGDHMSMYAVNASVPKTLIRSLIAHEAAHADAKLAAVLQDILDTPVSPELLPPADDGTMEQKTEDILGPYDIHDFLLYHFLHNGAGTEKLRALARHAFHGTFPEDVIEHTIDTFIKRFFTQQFKRSCAPDGPLTGPVGLSPRGGLCMPSDASPTVWQE